MKFGHFSHVWGKPGMTPSQRYHQLWRELVLADELDYDYGFAVEHHFRPDESWMSSASFYVIAAAARTKRIRLGAMGHVVPLHHPVRLAEEIALSDQMIDGRLEVGLVPGIVPAYFGPFGADYENRRARTLEFVEYMRAAYTDGPSFDFTGKFTQSKGVKLAVNPVQRPHPPVWIETRDPPTLEFCAREGINTGYFFLFDRASARGRYETYLKNWRAAGWKHRPNIAYSCAIYVDETDEKAIARGLRDAGRAYRGFLPETDSETQLQKFADEFARIFDARGEPGAAETVRHLVDPEWLFEHDLILVGSPETVARKLRNWAEEGVFNTFLGEFNCGSMAEADVMRSIRLFGTEVMPKLRGYEPF
jgi:alkanesulfonate monooxygenase SsuD/methylene tetrahydromethanopterin reductase-like flavin-dependent oxidoreductase (luciferase family)